MRNAMTIFAFVLGLSALPLVAAAEPDDNPVGGVIEEDRDPELAMPSEEAEANVSEEGRENSEFGRNVAEQARQGGREFGEAVADQARPDDAQGGPDNNPTGAGAP